jgi:hypothetical protein
MIRPVPKYKYHYHGSNPATTLRTEGEKPAISEFDVRDRIGQRLNLNPAIQLSDSSEGTMKIRRQN